MEYALLRYLMTPEGLKPCVVLILIVMEYALLQL